MDEEEEVGTGEGEGSVEGGMVLQYYLKVMNLFEHATCPLAVLDIAEKAMLLVNSNDPLSVSEMCHFQSTQHSYI